MVNQDGVESVMCHRGDGLGIANVRKTGLEVIVLSTETNPVVLARCRKLKIECIYDCDDKLTRLQALVSERGLDPKQVAYVGNDINDLECLGWVGLPIAVHDSEPPAISKAKYVTTRRGGHGAVREVCDLLLASLSKV
jgi:N-acylneuraminate cytidylyltransferase